MIAFRCSNVACGKILHAKEEHAGTAARCRHCGERVVVPDMPAVPQRSEPSRPQAESTPPTSPPQQATARRSRPLIVAACAGGAIALIALAIIISRLGTGARKGKVATEPTTDLPPTFTTWRNALTARGWRPSPPKGQLGFRYQTFTQSIDTLDIEVTITSLAPSDTMLDASARVASRRPHEHTDEAARKAYGLALRTLRALRPSIAAALATALTDTQEKGKTIGDGIPRWQGEATADDGWQVTACEYRRIYKNRDSSPLLLVMVTAPMPQAPEPTGSKLIGLSEMSYKVRKPSFGHCKISWKVRLTNRDSVPHGFYVKCQFLDADQMEVLTDSADTQLGAGETVVVTGAALVSTADANLVATTFVTARITR